MASLAGMPPKILASHESPLIYEPIFEPLFGSLAYRHWKRDDVPWQLRCIGGPGSGKTTFSSVVVKKLRNDPNRKNTAVVSIFLQCPTANGASSCGNTSFLALFLAEVAQQLGGHAGNSTLSGHDTADRNASESDGDEIEDLRSVIEARRGMFNSAFLVLDDLDLVWYNPSEYLRLEEELDRLQNQGFKIMATSRVPFEPDFKSGTCDVDKTGVFLSVWWECQACPPKPGYYICDECKDNGSRCPIPGHHELPLVQRRHRVQLDMGNHGVSRIEDLLRHFIQREHGYSTPDQQALSAEPRIDVPPMSALGRAFSKSPASAAALVTKLAWQSNGNITIALQRLEQIWEYDTIEAAEAIHDRLPRRIVTSFSTAAKRIVTNELGKTAINIIGKHDNGAGSLFGNLEQKLRETLPGDALTRWLLSSHRKEELLSATEGFLLMRNNRDEGIMCFNSAFYLFIRENYSNEFPD